LYLKLQSVEARDGEHTGKIATQAKHAQLLQIRSPLGRSPIPKGQLMDKAKNSMSEKALTEQSKGRKSVFSL